jgi:CheY-like chemotaxis protein
VTTPPRPARTAPPSGPPARRLRILLADDDEPSRELAAVLLRARGHNVRTARTGREAVTTARAGTFDVILMDVEMPELDGIAATKTLRGDARTARTPIVALTAHVGFDATDDYRRAGFTGYLVKPFDAGELAAAAEGADAPARKSAAHPARPNVPVDLEELVGVLLDGDASDVVVVVVRVFVEDAPGRMADLERAVDLGDPAAIRAAAHVYKSAAATVRARNLADALARVELAAAHGGVDVARTLLAEVQAAHQAVLRYLATAVER